MSAVDYLFILLLCSAFRPAAAICCQPFLGGIAIASLLNIIKFYSRLLRRSLHILKASIEGVLIVGYYLLVILAPLKNVQRVGMLPMLVGELLFSLGGVARDTNALHAYRWHLNVIVPHQGKMYRELVLCRSLWGEL